MPAYSAFSDQELTTLLRGGDHAAYTEIYNRYSGVLYLHAYNKLRNREEAKDILQELFTVIWRKREEIEFRSSLSGYLYVAIRNRIFKHIAHQQNEEEYIN